MPIELTKMGQLGQGRIADATTTSIYSPGAGPPQVTTHIKTVWMVNTSDAAAVISVFVDDDGTTYTEATAIAWEQTIEANSFDVIKDAGIFMDDSTGNLAIKEGTGDAITVTLFGSEFEIT